MTIERCPRGRGFAIFQEMLSRALKGTCLVWPYQKAGGSYGQLWVNGSHVYAHRLAWVMTFGPIPNNLHVLHHCDNPPCFNPFCLFLGTEKDNRDDQRLKGRTLCGERNPISVLTEEQVKQIRGLYQYGVYGHGQMALAALFGVTRIAIRKIIRRETWQHV